MAAGHIDTYHRSHAWRHLRASRIGVMLNYPRLLFLVSIVVLWVAAHGGAMLRSWRPLNADERDDFSIVQAACLTLLGLVIGFTFSMAISRYDQRKDYEEAEANAIGTEYIRAELLPATNAAVVRGQLRDYLGIRILFYRSRSEDELQRINVDTARLQGEMWSAVLMPALAQPSPLIVLAVAGMNDVLNAQGNTQAAWWNRIPTSAWALMIAIAVCCNVLVGYGVRSARANAGVLFVLPGIISISFLLIADVDSPRNGFMHVIPRNLVSLSEGLK
jgi:hypothetical protein